MQVKLAPSTFYEEADGKKYGPGDVIEVDEDTGAEMIRTGSALAADKE